MKITNIRVHVVSVPFTEPETWVFGRSWGLTSAVVEVETDDGIVGLGEIPGIPSIQLAVNSLHQTIDLLVDENPFAIREFLQKCRMRGWHHFPYIGNNAVAGLEMALWDIVAKASSQPLHNLFGGLLRLSVPYYYYVPVPNRDAATARRQAADAVNQGFTTLYFKIGFDIESDVSLIREVRAEVGNRIAIRVDANEAWSVFEAVRALSLFENLEVEFVEQPIDMHDFEGLRYLRSKTTTRIGANQSAWLAHDVPDLIRRQAADVIVTDPHQLGGLQVFRDVSALCEIAHIPVIKHSFGDLGLTTAATLHLLAALHPPVLAHQTHLTILEHDLLAERLRFQSGELPVPTGIGIGVELDREALQHYKKLYEKNGEYSGYGPIDAPIGATK